MRTTAIIQARMGSSRLPGKVLMDLGGETVLGRVVRRLRRARRIEAIAVATTDARQDEVIVQVCRQLNVPTFRGSEHDVLDRYFQAAKAFRSDTVVRITSDCPLIDPEIVDDVVSSFVDQQADFACNVLRRTYPRGLDAEVFSMPALTKAWQAAGSHQREHVTTWFYENPDLVRLASVFNDEDFSRHRWTVDTAEDLKLARAIYGHFANRDSFGWKQALTFMERRPDLIAINSHVMQKIVHDNRQAHL